MTKYKPDEVDISVNGVKIKGLENPSYTSDDYESNYLIMNVCDGVWIDLVKAKSMIKGSDYDNQGQCWIVMPETAIYISRDMYNIIKDSKEKGKMWRTSFTIK